MRADVPALHDKKNDREAYRTGHTRCVRQRVIQQTVAHLDC